MNELPPLYEVLSANGVYIIVVEGQKILFQNHEAASLFEKQNFPEELFDTSTGKWFHRMVFQYEGKDIYLYHDISDYKSILLNQQECLKQLKYDRLTSLYNRHGFEEKFFDQLIEGKTYILSIMDIDHFKRVNDTYGHPMGDLVLKRFAELITEHFKDELTGRYGGEEFVVVFFNKTMEEAYQLVDQFRKIVERTGFGHEKYPICLTASFGLSELKFFETTKNKLFERLIARADKSLYLAKTLGRNRVAIYHE